MKFGLTSEERRAREFEPFQFFAILPRHLEDGQLVWLQRIEAEPYLFKRFSGGHSPRRLKYRLPKPSSSAMEMREKKDGRDRSMDDFFSRLDRAANQSRGLAITKSEVETLREYLADCYSSSGGPF